MDCVGVRWRHNVDGCVENSDERISEVLETLLGKTESSVSSVSLRAHSHPAHDPASPQLPTAPRRYFLTVTALPSEGGRGRLPTRGPRAPVTTSCLTSHHDAISIWCDAGASAPGLLGKAAPGHSGSLHGCTVDARLVDLIVEHALASTRNCRRGSPCTSGTWSPTALSSAVTAFRCLDGYDRHREPPTPFGGRAASSSQLISRAWLRVAHANCADG